MNYMPCNATALISRDEYQQVSKIDGVSIATAVKSGQCITCAGTHPRDAEHLGLVGFGIEDSAKDVYLRWGGGTRAIVTPVGQQA